MKIDPSTVDLDDFQSPMFIVGRAPEALGLAVKPLILESMKHGRCVSVMSSFANFRELVQESESLIYHTIGNFAVAPLAVNCFEVPRGGQVASHAHGLASVVGNIYALNEKEISLLRCSIEKAYLKRGWNLLTNTNFRTDSSVFHPELFPCWRDVLQQLPRDAANLHAPLLEAEEFDNRMRSVIDELLGPLNSLAFICGKESMSKLSQGNHIFDLSALLPQAQLLAAWCLGLWTSLPPSALERDRKQRLIVLNLSEEASCAQNSGLKWPMIFSCAEDWSKSAAVMTLSRKWSLSRADSFEHGAKIINAEESVEIRPDSQHQLEVDDLSVRKRWLASELRIEPLVSYGEEFLPQAFLAELYGSVSSLIANEEYYRVYVRYLLAVENDPTQVVHYREKLVTEISMQIGRRLLNKMQVTWLILSLFTDRFFRDKAEMHSWSLHDEDDMRQAWYKILRLVFLQPTEEKLELADINSFRERLRSLQEVEIGPFAGCRFCETRCQFGHEVAVQMDDNLRYDIHSAINGTDEPASYAAAWFVRLKSEDWVSDFSIGLAYCLAVHSLESNKIGRETSSVILYKIREELSKFSEEICDRDEAE